MILLLGYIPQGESDSASELCPCFRELAASTDATPDPEESPGAEDNPRDQETR